MQIIMLWARNAAFGASICLMLSLPGCASLAERNEQKLTLSDSDAATDFKEVDFTEQDGISPYTFGKVSLNVQWIGCKAKNPKVTVLIMHSDRAGFDKAKLCDGWIAQTFLAHGMDVIAVNRPGYGASTGKPDFSGALSLAAVQAGVDGATKAMKSPALTGAWGYDTGASVAALAAKHLKGLQFLILGGGIYDYEEVRRATNDPYLKADIDAMKKTGGDKAIEDRSIGYDASGLPHSIAIYHGAQDMAVPAGQAKAFADSLESSGQYKVNLQIVEGLGHEIPWVHHRKLLDALVQSMTAAPAS